MTEPEFSFAPLAGSSPAPTARAVRLALIPSAALFAASAGWNAQTAAAQAHAGDAPEVRTSQSRAPQSRTPRSRARQRAVPQAQHSAARGAKGTGTERDKPASSRQRPSQGTVSSQNTVSHGAASQRPVSQGAMSTAARQRAARRLFLQGVASANAGHWRRATDRFHRSNLLFSSPTTMLNLATVLERRGRIVEAQTLVDELGAHPDLRPRVARAALRLHRSLRGRSGRVIAQFNPGPFHGETYLDGKAVPADILHIGMPIDPGKHVLEAHLDGRKVGQSRFSVAKGERRVVHVVVSGSASTPPAP